jgi:HK97 gp10 family phage protein
MSTVQVNGLSELAQFLDELPTKLQKNVMRGALRAGMKPVQADAKAGAAHASGQMRDGLKISTTSRGNLVTASLKATGPHGYLARFVEFGTSAHTISAKDGGALAFGGGVYQHLNHPGQKPRPFMRPALDGQASNAVVAAAEYMKDRLATQHGLDTAGIEIGEMA